ncbi:hypothetical protein WN943_027660 [Citrus x changshan-huyou]
MFHKLLLFGNDRVYCKSKFQYTRKKEIEMVKGNIIKELVKGLSRVSWGKIDVSFHNCRQRFAAQVLIVLYR